MAQIVAKRNPRLQLLATPRRDRGKLWLRLAKLVHRFHGTDHLCGIHVIHDGLYPGF
jgi:hypothetical protein